MWKPDCFDTEQDYDVWLHFYIESMGYAEQPEDVSLFCGDCTLAYRNQMIQEGRCMFPKTKFIGRMDDEEGFVEMYGIAEDDKRTISQRKI